MAEFRLELELFQNPHVPWGTAQGLGRYLCACISQTNAQQCFWGLITSSTGLLEHWAGSVAGAEGRANFPQNFFWVAREELFQSPHVLVKPSLCSPKRSDGWTLKKAKNTCHKNGFCFFKKSDLSDTGEAPLQTKLQQQQDSRVPALPPSVCEGQIQSLWSLSCLQCFISQALSLYSPLSL